MVVAAKERSHREQIRAMFKLYSAEMASFSLSSDERSPHQESSHYLGLYWEEPLRHAYILTDDDTAIGFCLVNRHSVVGDEVWAIAEFYVQPSYRRLGHGRTAARGILGCHGPDWEISVLSDNSAAIAFWGSLVADIAQGAVRQFSHVEEGEAERVVYRFNV